MGASETDENQVCLYIRVLRRALAKVGHLKLLKHTLFLDIIS